MGIGHVQDHKTSREIGRISQSKVINTSYVSYVFLYTYTCMLYMHASYVSKVINTFRSKVKNTYDVHV
jgi:hypothetical protein